MDTRKLRPSSNIEDRRPSERESFMSDYVSRQNQKDVGNYMDSLTPIDTNPDGWESVNKDYSKERR